MSGYARLAMWSVFGVYLLTVAGAIVRVTGSGLGCPDWPRCHGSWLPPLQDTTAMIEYTHRTVAALVGLPVLATVIGAWIWYRHSRLIFWSMTLLLPLLAVQIRLGGMIVEQELPPMLVLVHLTNAFIILALAIVTAVMAGVGPGTRDWLARTADGVAGTNGSSKGAAGSARYPRLLVITVIALLVLLLTGAYTRASGASWVCLGFPLCDGVREGRDPLVEIHLLHRMMATLVGSLVIYQAWWLRRYFGHDRRVVAWGALVALAAVVQFSIGVAQVSGPTQLLQILHVAGGAAVWTAGVTTAALVYVDVRRRRSAQVAEPTIESVPAMPSETVDAMVHTSVTGEVDGERPATRGWRAYVLLTKPRIIVLLLVTTLAGMLVAAEGAPPWGVVLVTLIGGTLAAGGANAINQYLDRDIDGLMGRTNLRPIPAGVVAPEQALLFGIALTASAVAVFVLLVNLLSGALALLAMLYYVFVYTRWLKRTTPSNILIGGAAGALPPVIGWTAVRGELDLLPIWLFAIVFYWTPPHFWALSLLIKQQYERAGVPMLPIVRGDGETRRQILWYSLLLVGLTALLVPFGMMGLVYLSAALALGGLFIYYAARLRIEATAPAARRMFRYSLYYLALLFAAMVVDRRVPLEW